MAAHPTKLQTYTRLAADNSAVVTSNFENWSAFLTTAAKFYKYTFLEQLMIHIQRPQATACAEYGTWSDEMHRYVRRFAKGIAVISFIDGQPTLRYVFDVADTGPKEGALYPFLWENRDEYQSVIPAALEGRFKVPCDQRGLPIQLANIAAQLAEQYWTNGEEQIIASIGDCPSNPTGETFQDAAAASITYALLSRCGLHPEQFFDASDFANVYKFNTFRMVLALGTAVSRCNEAVLRCIETSVKQYERDKRAGKLTQAPVPTAPAPAPSPIPAAPPVLAPEVEQPQSEDSSEVPDVQTFGASFVPPPDEEEEEQDAQQEIPMLPLALTPTLPPAENFHITDDHLGEGGPKAKYAMNVEAIKVLNHIEADGRTATLEEQEVLSRYVGWGGIPEAFDPEKPEWADEYAELKSLLTETEYASAQASTLNAHYTTPTVIRAIYEAIGSMGFVAGNILEPSCGVGNFFGCLPESMNKSKLYGVELDFITARIAQQLYPQADIVHGGFESTDRRDFFDIAVGNVPFGNYSVNDPVYNKYNFSIHNYFLCKALDQLRPGGIMAFVTSRYTMDAKDSAVRKYLAQRAELLGAIRLPNNAFRANAGTEVVSDIIFLQKLDKPNPDLPDWVSTVENEDGYPVNSYFDDHPEMVLGCPGVESTRYGHDYTVYPSPGADLAEQLHDAVSRIHGTYHKAVATELDDEAVDSIPADPNVKNFSYTLVNGEVYYRENSVMVRPKLNATAMARVRGMVKLRDCVHNLIGLQMDGHIPDSGIINSATI